MKYSIQGVTDDTAEVRVEHAYLASLWSLGSVLLLEKANRYELDIELSTDSNALVVNVDFRHQPKWYKEKLKSGEKSRVDEKLEKYLKELCEWVASLHQWFRIMPLLYLKRRWEAGRKCKPLHYQTHVWEHIWIVPREDHFFLILSLHMNEDLDITIAQNLCQEVIYAPRRGPPITFSAKGVPALLAEVLVGKDETWTSAPPNVGYVVFHLPFATVTENDLIACVTFRSFVVFHVTTSKTFIHTRMRQHIDVLLRSHQEALFEAPKPPKRNIRGKEVFSYPN